MKRSPITILSLLLIIIGTSCSPTRQLEKAARKTVLDSAPLKAAHIGITLFEPATGKYWYDYHGDKYFVPASNTKIITCYTAMKYLGDSLPAFDYSVIKTPAGEKILVRPLGDPTFLHPDFKQQRAFDFINGLTKQHASIGVVTEPNSIERWGNGWSWNDYEADYMAERNSFPIFGNVLDIRWRKPQDVPVSSQSVRSMLTTGHQYFDKLLQQPAPNEIAISIKEVPRIAVGRAIDDNLFFVQPAVRPFESALIPFVTKDASVAIDVLRDSLQYEFATVDRISKERFDWKENKSVQRLTTTEWRHFYSQPTDSMLRLMMHRSDNFFAEQSLLMVSQLRLGYFNGDLLRDSILHADLAGIPQHPRWSDGSGLSRYNLFSPRDFIYVLDHIRSEFGMDRVKNVFATGGEGTITSYYRDASGYIFGKTGTLSGVVAFSGYLYTKKGRLLEFSTLVNNHTGGATPVRRAIEKFLLDVREKY